MIHDKHAALLIRQEAPLNAGTPPHLLQRSFVTPNELFFVRNHAPIPAVDPESYRLTLDGMVRRPLSLSLAALRENFAAVEVVATLQCAGNRRGELLAVGPVPGELIWDADAISTAIWRGVALRDLLRAADPLPGAAHVALNGLDVVEKDGDSFSFGASIPLAKALQGEVILAYAMNGEPLPPAHGFPLRALVPGYIGARSVKWLGGITVQQEPSDNYFQSHAYKLFPPDASPETVDWGSGMMLGELSVTSVICVPQAGAALPAGPCRVAGYAMAGGGRLVERVDVSADGGATWVQAALVGPAEPWAWRLWEATLDLAPGDREIVARAWDSAANTQPEALEHVWNFKGYMNNAWHRVEVQAR